MKPSIMVRIGLPVAALVCVAALPNHLASAESGSAPVNGSEAASNGGGAFRHLLALQEIATANGGNRAAGTPGYDRSADYVAEKLRAAGYQVRFEAFEFPFFEERSPPELAVTNPGGTDQPAGAVRTLSNSGSGVVTAPLRAVKLGLGDGAPGASTSGCEAADFDGFARGAVALVRRGTCTFQVKVGRAVAAGAVGVVVMNEGTDGRRDAFSGQMTRRAAIPVVGVPYERGLALNRAAVADGGATVRLAVDAVTGTRTTHNVLADIPGSRADTVIMVGAHLDSVPEGPGINDNGSGSAAVLEAALTLARDLVAARAPVRFAFWGAEERGLIGSRHHVETLSEAERHRIALYINLDMVGSPNFVRFVQGTAAPGTDSPVNVARRQLLAGFRNADLSIEERTGGRFGSDDHSFSQKGIPTVGLYTGASSRKTEAEANLFGGTVGQPHDPCYHRACDTTENIDRTVLEQNTRALVRTLQVLTKPGR